MKRARGAAVKFAKILLRLAGLFVILVLLTFAAAAVVFNVMFTSETIKTIVISELQNVLHRPVQVQHMSALIYQGIRMRGVRVLEAPDFAGPEFISSDTLLAKYKWRALLRKSIELSEMRLVSPRIRVVRREDGRWNLEDIFVSSKTAHAEAKAGRFALPFSLAADVIAVDHGEIVIEDRMRQRKYDFRDVNLKIWKFDPTRPFEFEAKFDSTDQVSGREVRTRCLFKGTMSLAGFHWEESYLSAEKIRGQVDGKSLTATASLKDLSRPHIEVRARLPAVDSDFLAQYLPKAPPGIAVPPTQWRVSLTLPTTGLLVFDSIDAAAEPLRVHALGTLKADGELHRWRVVANVPSVPLARVGALWAGWAKHRLAGTASGSATLSGAWGDGALPITLEKAAVWARGFDGILFKSLHHFSRMDLNFYASDNLADVSFDVARGTAVVYGATLSDVNFGLRVRKGDLVLDHLNLTWESSRLKLRGSVKNLTSPQEVRLDGAVDRLRLDRTIAAGAEFVQQIKPPASKPRTGPWSRIFRYSFPKNFPAIAGRLKVAEVVSPSFETRSLVALWNLRGISTGLSKVGGDIKVHFGPGRVTDIPALEESSKILRVLFLPFVFMHKLNNMTVISAATAYPKTLDFDNISGEYGLKAGEVDMRQFHVDSGVLKAYADGIVNFPKEKVSLHVLTRLNDERGALPEYLTDQQGRPSIGFFVENDLNKPDLRIDFHKQESDAIEKAVQNAAKRSQPVFKTLEGGAL